MYIYIHTYRRAIQIRIPLDHEVNPGSGHVRANLADDLPPQLRLDSLEIRLL